MDAASLGVLQDITSLVLIAIGFGLVAYHLLRQVRPAISWHDRGNVPTTAYLPPDGLAVGALVGFLLLSTLLTPIKPADAPPQELSSEAMFTSLCFSLCLLLVILSYLRAFRRLDIAALFGLRVPFSRLWVILLIGTPVIIFTVAVFAYLVQEWLGGFWTHLKPQESVDMFLRSEDPAARGLLALNAIVMAPVLEESLFRGFLYGYLKRFTDSYFAALASALLFAIVHAHVGSLFPLAVLAVLLCVIYELTGSLLAPMMVHAAFNSLSIIRMLTSNDTTTALTP